jgi:hypothetical protein
MDTLVQTKPSANDLHFSIQAHLEELAQATDAASKSEEMLRYLGFCAKFHNYSPGNIWLIMFARSDATLVAGYHKWKTMGRWVQKGESGIPILAPVLVKEEDEDGIEKQVLVGFKVVYVFDVAQTLGEPLPEPPDWKSPEKNLELNERLSQFAQSHGISVNFKSLPGEAQGVSRGGAIDIDLSAGTKTIVHEIAHELMHKGKDNLQSTAIKELQAEAVAFVVCKHFGLGALNSPNYLAFFEVTTEQMFAHLETIRNTANKIITAINANS